MVSISCEYIEGNKQETQRWCNLLLYVTKVDIQLLQEARLALVALGGKRSYPSRLQATLLTHAPRDTARRGPEAKICAAAAAGRAAIAAVRSGLGGRRVAGDVAWCAVGGGIELKVLGGLGRVGGVALWRRAVAIRLGHAGYGVREGKEDGDDDDDDDNLAERDLTLRGFRSKGGNRCLGGGGVYSLAMDGMLGCR